MDKTRRKVVLTHHTCSSTTFLKGVLFVYCTYHVNSLSLLPPPLFPCPQRRMVHAQPPARRSGSWIQKARVTYASFMNTSSMPSRSNPNMCSRKWVSGGSSGGSCLLLFGVYSCLCIPYICYYVILFNFFYVERRRPRATKIKQYSPL